MASEVDINSDNSLKPIGTANSEDPGLQIGDTSFKHKPPPIDITGGQADLNTENGPTQPLTPGAQAEKKKEKEHKIGHRRVDDEGQITYKKIQTTTIMGSIQMGIQYAISRLASKPERDLLMQDFALVETIPFSRDGSNITPAHHFSDFRFKTYAPIAFRHFRDLFGIQPDDFLLSLCNEPMRELSNPGASGSIFYLTNDDEFIIKTVMHKEAEFLQKLLPGYYMNLNQNPRTLLPKFFGLYTYQCGNKNVRLAVMNNLLPSSIRMHQKYDLKGSTFKRKANRYERVKKSPTFKDLDFIEHHPDGIFLEAETYSALIKTIQRDCRVLESFKIMDYSLLVGIHNLDQAAKEKIEQKVQEIAERKLSGSEPESAGYQGAISGTSLTRSKSINRQRLAAFSTAMESIQAEVEPIDQDDDVPVELFRAGGIPARNSKGERLLLFLGIIDILQSYRMIKKLEHSWKSFLHDGDTVSVHRPAFYAQRFQDFMSKTVFKKIPSPLKHSPSKRKGHSMRTARPTSTGDSGIPERPEMVSREEESDTPVSPSLVAFSLENQKLSSFTNPSVKAVTVRSATNKLQASLNASQSSNLHTEYESSSSSLSSMMRTVTWTPPHSIGGSTPTHTEGTPSFTGSSSSGDIACPTTPVQGQRVLHEEPQPSSAEMSAGSMLFPISEESPASCVMEVAQVVAAP